MDAMERADVDAVLELLAEDAVWSMPPMASWYRGRETITSFLIEHALTERWRHIPTRANGQPAVGCYAWDAKRGCFVGRVLDVLTLDGTGTRIVEITAFVSAEVLPRFGLPDVLFRARDELDDSARSVVRGRNHVAAANGRSPDGSARYRNALDVEDRP